MNQDKKEELIKKMINYQLAFVNKTIDDVKDDPQWYSNHTLSNEQFQDWKNFCYGIFKKEFKLSKRKIEIEFSFFNLNYGLRVENEIEK